MSTATTSGCAAPDQDAPVSASVDLTRQTVIVGTVIADDQPVSGAYVRLLDSSGEFTAEVVTGSAGQFRFFAAPGAWQLRALSRSGNGGAEVAADVGVNELKLAVAAE
ncbi:MAG: DUF1416 domain-containing protein [Micromonosporaceae bacterium]